MNGKSNSGELSDGNEEDLTENWRKDNPRHKVSDLCSSILWKVEVMNDEIGYSVDIFSKALKEQLCSS